MDMNPELASLTEAIEEVARQIRKLANINTTAEIPECDYKKYTDPDLEAVLNRPLNWNWRPEITALYRAVTVSALRELLSSTHSYRNSFVTLHTSSEIASRLALCAVDTGSLPSSLSFALAMKVHADCSSPDDEVLHVMYFTGIVLVGEGLSWTLTNSKIALLPFSDEIKVRYGPSLEEFRIERPPETLIALVHTRSDHANAKDALMDQVKWALSFVGKGTAVYLGCRTYSPSFACYFRNYYTINSFVYYPKTESKLMACAESAEILRDICLAYPFSNRIAGVPVPSNALSVAMAAYTRAISGGSLPEAGLADLFAALEALWSNSNAEIMFRLQILLGKFANVVWESDVRKVIKEGYNVRSKFVHGLPLKNQSERHEWSLSTQGASILTIVDLAKYSLLLFASFYEESRGTECKNKVIENTLHACLDATYSAEWKENVLEVVAPLLRLDALSEAANTGS